MILASTWRRNILGKRSEESSVRSDNIIRGHFSQANNNLLKRDRNILIINY